MEQEIRRRKLAEKGEVAVAKREEKDKSTSKTSSNGNLESGTYWLTRIVFLRGLAFVYREYIWYWFKRGVYVMNVFVRHHHF